MADEARDGPPNRPWIPTLDELLTKSFEKGIKLVDQSIHGDDDEEESSQSTPTTSSVNTKKKNSNKKIQKPTTTSKQQDNNKLIFSNKSRKCRFEDNSDLIQDKLKVGQSTSQGNSNTSSNSGQSAFIIPPQIDLTKLPEIKNENEAHTSMLMSWYMAGYHTGYFQAMKKSKNQ